MSKLLETLKQENNQAFTANAALSNRSTLNKVLDLFARGGALRGAHADEIIKLFGKAYSQDPLLATKCLFYIRDVRGGQGERRTFKLCWDYLCRYYPETARKNLSLVPEYGRFDEWFDCLGGNLENDVIELTREQIKRDQENLRAGKPISLLGKWLPSIYTSSETTQRRGKKVAVKLGLTREDYRKVYVEVRKALQIVEQAMSAGNWGRIEFQKVPSRAAKIYRKAFLKHDKERYTAYLEAVKRGETKINAGALFPYELVQIAMHSEDPTIELQWKALPNYLDGQIASAIAVVDVSGSMSSGMGSVAPINISLSLGVYLGERLNGPFKDHFITFSESPKLEKISGPTLHQKLMGLCRSDWGMNTNLQAVFDLVLKTAVKHKLSQSDIPGAIVIISDMQFDVCTSGNDQTNFQEIERKFKEAGYERPELIFWNVNAQTEEVPVLKDTARTKLVSGCSPSLFKSVLSGKTVTPEDYMLSVLNGERYQKVMV